jgi:hypothetical protein
MGETYPLSSGTCTGGSTTTVVDTSRDEDDDFWVDSWVYITDTTDDLAPEAEERLITNFVSSTGAMTISPAFSATVAASDTYELRDRFPRWQYNDAVNHAIREARNAFYDYTVDETTIVIVSDQREYNLPSGLKSLLRVDIERTDVHVSSTATGSSNTTLEDTTQSWDTDEWNTNYAVVIYDGTGEGQQRTITDTTSTAITVATWTTNPDTTSKYKIKYIGKEELTWAPITAYTWDKTTTGKIHLYDQYEEGMSLRLYYASEPAELSAEASITYVPDEYIILEGMAYLYELAAGKHTAREDVEFEMGMSNNLHTKAEQFKVSHGYRLDRGRIISTVSGAPTLPDDYPW